MLEEFQKIQGHIIKTCKKNLIQILPYLNLMVIDSKFITRKIFRKM